LVQKEAQRWTGWEASPGEIPQQYWARLSAEWRAADFVVVNSEWSRDALVSQGVTTEKVIVVPLAYEPPSVTQRVAPRQTDALKVLWLGTVCLRKGIQYLLAAAKELLDENIEFKIAGPISISQDAIKTAPKNTTFIGRVTRDQASHHYLNADLFVLPTVSDGFAVTQLEAMAHGLPVITTPNCGRVVTSGSDGFVVPACDASSLAKAILACHRDRDLLSLMSANALETSKQYRLPRQAVEINSAVNRLVV
jgi:glycosyltransferase involved in cell wall biosynthesis